MAKVYLFDGAVTYKWVKQAFERVVQEYLPSVEFAEVGEIEAWKKYLSFFINHNGPYITDRSSSVYFKEIPTYLEFVAIPNRTFLHLYDGIERMQKDVRVFDEYPIKGIVLAPENPERGDKLVEGLVKFIKNVIDVNLALENSKKYVSGL